MALTETKKCKTFKPSFPNYITEHFARSKIHKNARSASGGCLILIKKELKNLVEILPPENEHIIWLKITQKNNNYTDPTMFGIVYTSPEESTYKPETDFFTSLQNDIIKKI